MFRYSAVVCLVAVLFSSVLADDKPVPDRREALKIAQHLQDISVTVRAGQFSGSGVMVRTKDGTTWIWTAAHVVATLRNSREIVSDGGSKRIKVDFDDARIMRFHKDGKEGRIVSSYSGDAEVIRYSDANFGHDLCLLRLRDPDFKPPASVRFFLDDRLPDIGDDLFHCGSLLGPAGSNSLTTGILSQHGRVIDGKVFDQTSCTAFPGCLPADALIMMSDGSLRKIVDVKHDDRVISYDSDYRTSQTAALRYGKVTRVIESGVKKVYEIKTGNHKLLASGNHPVLMLVTVPGIGHRVYLDVEWRRVDQLERNNVIVVSSLSRGSGCKLELAKRLLPDELRFEGIEAITEVGEEKTYDLTVANYHNFFANGVLVHNSSGGVVSLRSDGRYVGMLVMGAGEGFNLIVPVRRMRTWAKQVGVEFALDPTKDVPKDDELKGKPVESELSGGHGQRANRHLKYMLIDHAGKTFMLPVID